jgi:hypothetical protein
MQHPPLPRSLDPLPGEALDGFLLRLAYRLELSPARIAAIGGITCAGSLLQLSFASLLHLTDEERARFARAVRLLPAEIARLCLSSLGERYAPVSATASRAAANVHGRYSWVFAGATRYCPECLAGDGSRIQNDLGGAWQKAWRLPVVFACTSHGRFLEHLCPGCQRPAHGESGGSNAYALPQLHRAGLHPAQCRYPDRTSVFRDPTARRLCGVSLASAEPPAILPEAGSLQLQDRISDLLNPGLPGVTTSVGLPCSAREYFADLCFLTLLIRRSWPRVKDVRAIGESAEKAMIDDQERIQQLRTDRLSGHRPGRPNLSLPPLDSQVCAALLTTASQLLDSTHPKGLTRQLIHLLEDPRNGDRAQWARNYMNASPGCSAGLSRTLFPALQGYGGKRNLPRKRLIRRTRYEPEHVAQYLQDDWYGRHFAGMTGISPRHLRRAAAIWLCQLAGGGSAAAAARFLDIGADSACNSLHCAQLWARESADPRQLDAALHDLADDLDAAPRLIDYRRRREALRGWCLPSETWQLLCAELPLPDSHARPDLGDRKRQTASILAWVRVTQGDPLLAPHPIRDQQPDEVQKSWRNSTIKVHARFKAGGASAHEIDLRQVLHRYADAIAKAIDHGGVPAHGQV